jgi:hypothetical protein
MVLVKKVKALLLGGRLVGAVLIGAILRAGFWPNKWDYGPTRRVFVMA